MCEYIVRYAMRHQGSRIAVVRKTRTSMSETTLVTLERVIQSLHPPALTGAARSHVTSYRIGKSDIVLFGCEDEERLRGLEASIVWCDEATELSQADWSSLSASLRWPVAAWKAIIATCNPDAPTHWLWKRFKDGLLTRIQSSHKDNPNVTQEYLDRLARLPAGVFRQRFYEGLWTAAEGQVLDAWDPLFNIIDCPVKADGSPDHDALSISWYFASVDWGHSVAGVIDVWGVALDGSIILVREVYQTKKTGGWWCNRIVELNQLFKLRAIVCDHDPGMIEDFNTRLGYAHDRPDSIAWGADKRRGPNGKGDLGGIGLLCEMVAKRKLKVLRDYQHSGVDKDDGLRFGPFDQALRDAGLPECSVDEVPGYVWLKSKDGRYLRDTTDPTVPDHGMDAWRYACMFARGRDMSDPPMIPKDDPESYGALYNHNALVAAMKVAQDTGEPMEDIYQAFLEEQGGR